MATVEEDIGNIYSKIEKINVRLTAIEETRPFLKEIIERNTKTNEELSKTLQEVQTTMVQLNSKMDEQSKTIEAMKIDMEKATQVTNERIEEVNRKVQGLEDKHDHDATLLTSEVEKLENKGKFDIMEFIKKYFPWIVVGIGYVVFYFSNFIKF